MQTPVHAIGFITVNVYTRTCKTLTSATKSRCLQSLQTYYIKSQQAMVDTKFKRWFENAHTLLQSVSGRDYTSKKSRDIMLQVNFRNLLKRALAIPFLDNIIEQLQCRFNKERRNC